MTTRTLTHHPARPSRTGLLGRLSLGLGAWRQRRALSRLDPHLLRDIGLTRDAAAREASRPAWDVPEHWLR